MISRASLVALIAATACIPATAMGLASAELYSTKSYFYGRFDARIRFAPGDGVISSFFLWKEGSDAANAYWNELDMEKFGAGCQLQTNAFYGNPETQHQQKPSVSINMCTEYHDYRFEWTPTYIAWVIDGKEIRRDTGATATAFAQNATAGMSFHFNIWPGNSEFGGNINNTTLPVRQYISWVRYSSHDNGNFTEQWREEFQTSGVPTGWAVGTWSSPFNLSTHNAQNVGYVNGIAVLALTADNGTGNPGTPPVDPNAGGAGGSTGSATGGTTGSGSGGSSGGAKSSGGTTGVATTGIGGATSLAGKTATGGATSAGGTTTSGTATAAGGSIGGTTGPAVTTASGGSSGSGSTTVSGGTMAATDKTSTAATSDSGGTPAAGTTEPGGTTAAGGAPGGFSSGTTTDQGGCSCSTAHAASPSFAALIILFLIVSRLRRKEI